MAINLAAKYSTKLDERFRLASLTDAYAGKKYEFTGVNTIKIWSVDQVKPTDYNRSASSFRFGTVNELGDTVQTMVLTKDRGLTFAIDHGNNQEQFNIKHCNSILKTNWDEVVAPEIDMYRIKTWLNGAGQGAVNGTALTKSTIIEAIMTGGAALSNRKVPKKNRVLFIRESVYIYCKLASEIVGIDTLGEKSVRDGSVGTLDGMKIVPIPDSYMPTGINFLIKYKDSTVDPQTLKVLRVQKNPIGFDADVGECRYIYDSFVLGNKADGLYVHAQSGVQAAPTISISGNQATITASGSTSIKYTTDGTNPKTSPTAQTYSAAVPTTAGTVVKAYATKTGSLDSAIAVAVDA